MIQKAQFVRGPFPKISWVIVKLGEKFRLEPDCKLASLPLLFFFSTADENAEEAEKEKDGDADDAATPMDTGAGGDAAPAAAPKKGMKLSYDEYRNMANLLVCHMRKVEEQAQTGERRGSNLLNHFFFFMTAFFLFE